MIIRIVKLEFKEDYIPDFLRIFAAHKEKIRTFPGCTHLQLLQDKSDARVFFTYSHWERLDDLTAYRSSALFEAVWEDTKKLFRNAPQVWSLRDRTEMVPDSV